MYSETTNGGCTYVVDDRLGRQVSFRLRLTESRDITLLDQIKFIGLWNQDDGDWKIHRDIWNSSTADEQ